MSINRTSLALKDKLQDCINAAKESIDPQQKESMLQTQWFDTLQTTTPFYLKHVKSMMKLTDNLSHPISIRFIKNCADTLYRLHQRATAVIDLFNTPKPTADRTFRNRSI